MRKLLLTVSASAVLVASQTLLGDAKPVATTGTGTATPSSGSVTVAVTTDGYEFTPEIGVLIPPSGVTPIPVPPQVIKACVVLANNTKGGICCALSDTGTAGQRFEFTLFDSNGKVVWDSLPRVLPPLSVLVTLGAGDAWRGSVSVPLVTSGQALPPGTYTLQATLFGSPTFVAVTTIVVHNVIAIN